MHLSKQYLPRGSVVQIKGVLKLLGFKMNIRVIRVTCLFNSLRLILFSCENILNEVTFRAPSCLGCFFICNFFISSDMTNCSC